MSECVRKEEGGKKKKHTEVWGENRNKEEESKGEEANGGVGKTETIEEKKTGIRTVTKTRGTNKVGKQEGREK